MFRNKATFLCLLGGLLATGACRQDMHNQPRYKPFAATDFFGDGRSARPVIADTVARGQLHIDEARARDHAIFRLDRYSPLVLVNERVKKALTKAKLSGVELVEADGFSI